MLLQNRDNPIRLRQEVKEVNKNYRQIDFEDNNDDDISSRCIICKIAIHRASFAKHLIGEKHLENEKEFTTKITEWFFHDLIENKPNKIHIIPIH